MIKTTGREFKSYYFDKSAWPDGAWHEEETMTIDGVVQDQDNYIEPESIPDSAIISLSHGCVFMSEDGHGKTMSMEAHFKRWKKAQTMMTIVIEFDKADESFVRDGLSNIGSLKVLL